MQNKFLQLVESSHVRADVPKFQVGDTVVIQQKLLDPVEVSVGDFVCNGGEVPAMVVIDTVIRLVPGVLGDEASAADESHSAPGRIEYPQYTRPRVFRGLEVPEVLLSGNHGAVARWREEQSRLRSERNTNG